MSYLLAGKPLVEVRRGGHLESVHYVAACACSPDGKLALEIGDIQTPIFVRSALKPIIAATVATAVFASGGGLTSEELAVMASSHFGEPQHVAVVEQLLARSGSTEADLQCGASRPRNGDRQLGKRAVYNNCSGKHAGLLLLCKLLGVDSADYLSAAHPVNEAWMATAGRIYGVDVAILPKGIDGCGLPVFAVSLHAQAQGYARFVTLHGIADQDRVGVDAVRRAMPAHPHLVGGTGHLDTALMQAGGGAILAKIGAEGVHCSAVEAHNLALAVKVLDGHERARPPAVVGLLRRLGVLTPAALGQLHAIAAPVIHNVVGLRVGDLRFSEESLLP